MICIQFVFILCLCGWRINMLISTVLLWLICNTHLPDSDSSYFHLMFTCLSSTAVKYSVEFLCLCWYSLGLSNLMFTLLFDNGKRRKGHTCWMVCCLNVLWPEQYITAVQKNLCFWGSRTSPPGHIPSLDIPLGQFPPAIPPPKIESVGHFSTTPSILDFCVGKSFLLTDECMSLLMHLYVR